jgi:hypothetical protein
MRKFSRKLPVALPGGAVLQLACGWDFFGNGFGNRHTPETIDAMRAAWRDAEVRRLVDERTRAAHGPDVRPFAVHLFGLDGRGSRALTAADVQTARTAYRRETSKHLFQETKRCRGNQVLERYGENE